MKLLRDLIFFVLLKCYESLISSKDHPKQPCLLKYFDIKVPYLNCYHILKLKVVMQNYIIAIKTYSN